MHLSPQKVRRFQQTIYRYYKRNRRIFLWRPPSLKLRRDKAPDPYRILVSEIMLQQTQVARVLKKYPEFLRIFPTWSKLARAPLRKVLHAWSGLGYNRRALLLHKTAKIIAGRFYQRKLPRSADELKTLPGIGHATASAICAFAFNQPVVFIETNIRSVFIYFFFIKRRMVTDSKILPIVGQTLDRKHPREWYYALMDYGAMLKKTQSNPSRRSAHHIRQAPFRGSQRELRGKILKLVLTRPSIKPHQAAVLLKEPPQKVRDVFRELHKEGLV